MFTYNALGRMVRNGGRWPTQERAPRLFVGCTPQRAICRMRDDIVTNIQRLISQVPVVEDITADRHIARMEAILAQA